MATGEKKKRHPRRNDETIRLVISLEQRADGKKFISVRNHLNDRTGYLHSHILHKNITHNLSECFHTQLLQNFSHQTNFASRFFPRAGFLSSHKGIAVAVDLICDIHLYILANCSIVETRNMSATTYGLCRKILVQG